MARIASAAHGTGTGITARSAFHGDIVLTEVHGVSDHIGTDGGTAIGAATDISILGSMTHGITEDGTTEECMILGIMEATMVITDGPVPTTVIISITDGMTHTITITDMARDTYPRVLA